MFEVGEYIICGNNGVCRVENIGPMKISGMKKTEFITRCPLFILAEVWCILLLIIRK